MQRRYFINIIIYLVIIVIVFISFINLFYPKLQIFSTPDFGESDLWMFNIPIKFFLSTSLKQNMLPLWSKDIGSGFPLIAESQIGAFNPINLIIYKFLPFVVAFNILYIVTFLTTAFGTFFFCRSISISKISSFFSSIIFTFSGFFIAHITHVNLIQTASLLPWLFFLTYKIFQKPQKNFVIFFSLATTISFFSGFAQVTFITFIGIFLFLVFLIFNKLFSGKDKKFMDKNIFTPVIMIVIGVIGGIAISSIQLIPSFEFLLLSQRSQGFSLQNATYFSFPPEHLLGFIDPFVFGNPATGTYPPFWIFNGSIFWENTGYIGILPILLIFLCFIKIKKNKFIIFFLLLLLISALLMLGSYSPIKGIYSLPLFSLFHVPSRFILLFIWASALLTGISLNQLQVFLKKYMGRFSYVIITILISLSFFNIYFAWKSYHMLLPASQLLDPPQTAKLIKNSGNNGKILTIGDGEIWNKVFVNSGWPDTKPYLYFRNSLRQNFNIIFDIKQSAVYAGSILRRSGELINLTSSGIRQRMNDQKIAIAPASIKLLKLQNVGTIISTFDVEGDEFKKIATVKSNISGISNFYVYQQTQLNRAFVVYKKIVSKKEDIPNLLISDSFNPLSEVLLETNDKSNLNANNISPKVKIAEDSDNVLKLKIDDNPSLGYLVVSDTYYPGWEATIDGKKTNILVANLAQRAILLPSGTHTVIFTYKPISFLIGALITMISMLIAVILLILPKNLLLNKTRKLLLFFI